MKKLFAILCVLGVLFGGYVETRKIGEKGNEALENGDYQKAIDFYLKACLDDEYRACDYLFDFYSKHSEKAKELLEKKCNENDANMCYGLGAIYGHIGKRKEASAYYKKACDNKNGWGCSDLGFYYEYGLGGEKSSIKARDFYIKGCDYGFASSCAKLGFLHKIGDSGFWKDDFEAFKFYQKACNIDGVSGCSVLAEFYREGRGVRQDKLKAIGIYKKLCDDKRIEDGCSSLAMMYEHDFEDKKQAKEYYGKSCDLESSFGCKKYAELNEAGY